MSLINVNYVIGGNPLPTVREEVCYPIQQSGQAYGQQGGVQSFNDPILVQQQLNNLSGGGFAPGSMDLRTAATVLQKNWDKVKLGDGGTPLLGLLGLNKTTTKDKLKEIVASDSASPELKAACNAILNTPGAFEKISSAYNEKIGLKKEIGGGNFSSGDLNTFLSPGWTG